MQPVFCIIALGLIVAAMAIYHFTDVTWVMDEEQVEESRLVAKLRQAIGLTLLGLSMICSTLVIIDRYLPATEITEITTYLDFPVPVIRYESSLLKHKYEFESETQAAPREAWGLLALAAGYALSRIGWRKRIMRRYEANFREWEHTNREAREDRTTRFQQEEAFKAYRHELIGRYGPFTVNIGFTVEKCREALLYFPERRLLLLAEREIPIEEVGWWTEDDNSRPSRQDPAIIRHDYTIHLHLKNGEEIPFHIGRSTLDKEALEAVLATR